MKKEVQQIKDQSVFTEIDGNTVTPEQRSNIMESRWALKQKNNEVRARRTRHRPRPTLCKDETVLYTESSSHNGIGVQLVSLYRRCECCMSICSSNLIQFGNETAAQVLQRRKQTQNVAIDKAIYGSRSLPKQWQDHIAHILTVTLELVRCATEGNVYRSKDCVVYIMIYVDDLLFIGVQNMINRLFSRMQKEVLLRHTGDLNVGSTIHFLGRNISQNGSHIDISLNNNYVDGMTTCNPAPSPRVSHMKSTAEDEALLDHEQHKQYRRLVGKIQWLAYTHQLWSKGTSKITATTNTV